VAEKPAVAEKKEPPEIERGALNTANKNEKMQREKKEQGDGKKKATRRRGHTVIRKEVGKRGDLDSGGIKSRKNLGKEKKKNSVENLHRETRGSTKTRSRRHKGQ